MKASRRSHRPWTRDEEAEAWRLHSLGRKNAEIAKALERSREAVGDRLRMLKRIGPNARPIAKSRGDVWSKAEEEDLIRRVLAGESIKVIANATGRTHRAVGHRRRALKEAGRLRTPEQIAAQQAAEEAKPQGPDFIERMRELGRLHGYRSDLCR